MKNPDILSEGVHHTAIHLGKMENLAEYTMIHPKLQTEVKGKIFTGEKLKSTGSEISFTVLPPYKEIPFIHQHHRHEEIYVILKGSGQFRVDDATFDISEGTVIRVSPEGKRTYRNTSPEPLIFLCIQSCHGSLQGFNVSDGFRTPGETAWGT
ncbi:MAG TPA: cupin domain-containing protein [Bacteroidales bacterium]|nr:cupin domain-containing protein [Bacteroidales bacterium]